MVVAYILLAFLVAAQAALWPLDRYAICGKRTLLESEFPKPSLSDSDFAYDSDAGLVWITTGPVLYKTEYATGKNLMGFKFDGTGACNPDQLCRPAACYIIC